MKTIKPEKLYINDDYQIKYHIDEFGVYWYNYKDLIKVLLITSRKSDQIYRDWLNENDKTWFNELNILNNGSRRFCFRGSNGPCRQRLCISKGTLCTSVAEAPLP